MLIVQITDCHVVESGRLVADRVDSAAGLRAAIAQIDELPMRPDLVVATGDLVNDGRPEQYDRLEELLEELDSPFVPLPGNHDDRSQLRRRFAGLPPGDADQPIDHVLDLDVAGGTVRSLFLDTQIPGAVGGRLTTEQCDWIDRVLAAQPDRPTIVFQHHPPFATGIDVMDRDGFDGAGRYEEVIARHPQVQVVSCGHLHRAIHRRFGNTVACTWPSTSAQLDLGLGAELIRYTTEPAGIAVHHWSPSDGLRSHLQPVGDFDRWTPQWALDSM